MKTFKCQSIFLMVGLASAIVVTPLVIYLKQASNGPSVGTHSFWAIVLVGLFYVLVQRFAVRINIAQLNRNYVVTEVPMLLGAVFLPPLIHVFVRFVAAATGQLGGFVRTRVFQRRKQPSPMDSQVQPRLPLLVPCSLPFIGKRLTTRAVAC